MSQSLIRFGVVTDVQYADSDDRPAGYDPSKTRYYRNSLRQVFAAFERWNTDARDTDRAVNFVLQLGDIIDGINKSEKHETSINAIKRTLYEFEINAHIPTFHTIGNHELYNFDRQQLAHLFQESLFSRAKVNNELMRMCDNNSELIEINKNIKSELMELNECINSELMHINGNTNNNELTLLNANDTNSTKLRAENPRPVDDMTLYYKFSPRAGIKFISLDCFDISVLGHEKSHPNYIKAAHLLYQYHSHNDFDGWDLGHLLFGSNKRFQSSNGAISDEQLQWLDNELQLSDESNEVVVVFGHVGLHPDSCPWDSIMWNYDEVIACFNRHPSVAAYLCGHSHIGGYAIANGVHYVVFQAIVETIPEESSFATVTLFEDRFEIEGHGIEMSRTLYLQNRRAEVEEECDDVYDDSIASGIEVRVEV